MSDSDVVEYLSKYFVPETVQRLIQRHDLRSLNIFDIMVDDAQIEYMQNEKMITRYEANTLRMLIRTRKINKLLQELNEAY